MSLAIKPTGLFYEREAIIAGIESIDEKPPIGVAYELRWKFVLRDCNKVAEMLKEHYGYTARSLHQGSTLSRRWAMLTGEAPPASGLSLGHLIGRPCVIHLDLTQSDEFRQPLVEEASVSELPHPRVPLYGLIFDRQVRREALLRQIIDHADWVRDVRRFANESEAGRQLSDNGLLFELPFWGNFPPPFRVELDGLWEFVLDWDENSGDVLTDPRYRLDASRGASGLTPVSDPVTASPEG